MHNLKSSSWSAVLTLAAGCFVSTSFGCATFNPTLAPVRVLPAQTFAIEAASGYSTPVADSTAANAQAASQAYRQSNTSSLEQREALVRGALTSGASPSGVGTYLGARVGLGGSAEGSIGLLGRVLRIGGRRVFWTDHDGVWAFSLGIQGRFGLAAGLTTEIAPGAQTTDSRLYGADLQAVIGRTNSDLYDLWLGVRVGGTHADATLVVPAVRSATFFGSLDRLDVAATLGLRVGFGHLAALVEIEGLAGYLWARSDVGLGGALPVFALTPAAGLSYKF